MSASPAFIFTAWKCVYIMHFPLPNVWVSCSTDKPSRWTATHGNKMPENAPSSAYSNLWQRHSLHARFRKRMVESSFPHARLRYMMVQLSSTCEISIQDCSELLSACETAWETEGGDTADEISWPRYWRKIESWGTNTNLPSVYLRFGGNLQNRASA